MKRLFGFLLSLFVAMSSSCRADEVEVGKVKWGRDLTTGLEQSRITGKPLLLFFQEVPGCAGCQKFGREVMSHPAIVETIESAFVPVLVYNNRPGNDATILKRFNEPAWNYQVIRFLDASGNDLIPRKDGVWTVEVLAGRLGEALEAAGSEIPGSLRSLTSQISTR